MNDFEKRRKQKSLLIIFQNWKLISKMLPCQQNNKSGKIEINIVLILFSFFKLDTLLLKALETQMKLMVENNYMF